MKDTDIYKNFIVDDAMKRSIASIKQLDENGYLYSMKCEHDHYGRLLEIASILMEVMGGAGCSAFVARSEEGNVITCRNYDLAHKDSEDNITGLNVVLECAPSGRYRSLAIADGCWLSLNGPEYSAGSFSDSSQHRVAAVLLPYLCVDGMNEKGLCVSVLALDTKDGENPVKQCAEDKRQVNITLLLRLMLDNCQNVEEAVEMADRYNMVNSMGKDYHIFVTDSNGASVVLEWRHDKLHVAETDAVTNFYVGFDDACDCYKEGRLKERYKTPKTAVKEYRYGYGHGYDRFEKIVSAMDEHSHIDGGRRMSCDMTLSEAKEILKKASQKYTPGDLTSNTQYSIIYDLNNLSAQLWLMRDFEKKYSFTL